jgi:hypothetical protein
MNITRLPWAPRAGASSRLPRRPVLGTGLGLGLALGVLVGASCNFNVESVYTCLTNEDCIEEGGMGGVCEPNNLCTFPDAACPSGKRWHERAAELASKCYEPGDVGGGTDTVAGTASETGGSGSGSESGGGSSSGPGMTTLPADDTSDGSSSGMPPADTGSSSSGGMAGTCDDTFGTAAAYMLCEEAADSCMFNVMLTMTSCDALCMSFGSTCIEGFTNAETGCVTDGPLACDDATTNESVCRCAKP